MYKRYVAVANNYVIGSSDVRGELDKQLPTFIDNQKQSVLIYELIGIVEVTLTATPRRICFDASCHSCKEGNPCH